MMTQEHQPQHGEMTDGQYVLHGCPSFETLCLYFDNELSAADIESLTSHIDQCANCTAALRDMRLLRQALLVTSPAVSQRSIRLTEADVEGERPVLRALEPVAPVTPLRRHSRLAIPFAPAIAAIAALLLIAVVLGDVMTRDDSTTAPPAQVAREETAIERPTMVIDGTPFVPTDEDFDSDVDAASNQDINPNPTDEAIPAPGQQADDGDGFWSWWRAAEVLLIAVLAGLLATIYVQRRAPRN